MSVPGYQSYRDSGIEWLGLVPSHWSTLKLSRLVDPRRAITYGIVQAGPDIEGGVPYIRPADMTDESGVRNPSGLLRTSGEIATAYRRSTVQTGDIVCSIGPSFGKVMIVPSALDGANLTQGTARVAVGSEACARYVFWTLRSRFAISQWESGVGGATFGALNLEPLARTLLCCPPPPEQIAIAAFLDRETGKIDALVEAQRRLTELLKEKRRAVISHAVTKGLDPTAQMKDSGVEWLGEVPAHWEVKAIKMLSPVFRGASPRPIEDPKYFDDDGEFCWVRIADVSASDGVLRETPQRLSDLGSSLSVKLQPGSLFISIAGTVGKPCITSTKACIHDGFVYFPRLGRESGFLYRIFEGGACYAGLGKMGTQLNLNTDTVGSIRIALPGPDEMAEISDYLDRETARLSALVSQAEAAVVLLQERRAALISAAVTGKIDVRGVVSNETEAA